MNQGRNTEETVEEVTQEPTEPISTEEDRRTALEAAIAAHSHTPAEETPVEEEPQVEAAPVEPELPPLQAPSEFTREEKEDFALLTRKQQEAQLRLHRTRTASFSREFGSTKKLTENVRTYLDVMGKRGLTPEEAIQKAIALYNEFDETPEKAIKAFAAAKKLDLSRISGREEGEESQPEFRAIKDELDSVKNFIEEQKRSGYQRTLADSWTRISSQTNASGKPVFVDLNDSEAGIELAGKIGTLISDAGFQQAFRYLNPESTVDDLILEAYRRLGGRIDQSDEAPRSQPSQNHVAKSRRASASVPGRGAQTGASKEGKKYKSYREAAEAALAQLSSD